MKYKILLTGQNRAIMDDFFSHMGEHFECQSTSIRYEDIISHIEYFHPDAFVCCIHKEVEVLADKINDAGEDFKKAQIPLIIIGAQDCCDEYARQSSIPIDLVVTKPFTATVIREKISHYLGIRKEKQEAEDLKRKMAEKAKYLEQEKGRLKQEQQQEEERQKKIKQLEEEQKQAAQRRQEDERRREEARKQAQEEDNTATAVPNAGVSAASQPQSTSRRHILVVDDDPRMLKTIKKHLDEDYDIATAISGKLALKFLESKTTDLVLLDYEMPGEKGPDVLEKIRANPATSHIPVVFLTGITERAKIQKAISMKPRGYLLKPINHDVLMSTLKEILG